MIHFSRINNKTIYLYIGMGKAGSSYIQRVFSTNKDLFQERNSLFYFEKEAQELFGIPVEKVGIEPIIHKIVIGELDYFEMARKLKSEVLSRFSQSGCNKMILMSDEMFHFKDNMNLAKYLINKGFSVKVIVYVRRPVEFLASVWGERLKPYIPERMRISMEEENEYYSIPFDTILNFIDAIGKENVIVRAFEKEQWKNHEFLDDFLSCLDIEPYDDINTDLSRNPSYSRNMSELFLLINCLRLQIDRTQYYKKRLLYVTDDNDIQITETLSDDYIDIVTERYKPILTEIAHRYNKDSLFINDYPKCYHTERDQFSEIHISMIQMNILKEAIEEALNG